MRIHSDHSIRIFAKAETIEFLKKLEIGRELQAKVVARPSEKEALLDIMGRRIRAAFPRGVPAEDSLLLKLAGIRGKTFEFRLVSVNDRASILERLLGYSLHDFNGTEKDIMSRLRLLSGRNITSLFEFNSVLLRLFDKTGDRGGKKAELMNDLLRLGLSSKALSQLAYMNASSPLLNQVILPILFLLQRERKPLESWGREQSDIEGNINKIIDEVDNIVDEGKKTEAVRALLSLLSESLRRSGDFAAGDLAYFDGEKFNPVSFIGGGNSWLFRFFLSGLGELEVLAVQTYGNKIITLFSDNNESLAFLRDSKEKLIKRLRKIDPDIYLQLSSRQKVLSSINEMISELSQNYSIDLRV